MATFVKGDFVQVTPKVDWRWDQWKIDHTNLCEKTCKVVDTNYEKWTDQLFVEVEHRGKRLWFLDRHLIKVDNYEEVFQESIHRACENLQKHEEICKNLRDETSKLLFYKGERVFDEVQNSSGMKHKVIERKNRHYLLLGEDI